MTNAEAWFNNSLRPRKPEGSLGRTAQDGHLDSHTAPELCGHGGPSAQDNWGQRTLDNWGHKTPTQSKKRKDRKQKVKGSQPETHTTHSSGAVKNRIPCVTDENSKRNICSHCISKTYCHLGYKNGGRSIIGRIRPQNNMFEKSRTSAQHTSQQSNTTYCISFTT